MEAGDAMVTPHDNRSMWARWMTVVVWALAAAAAFAWGLRVFVPPTPMPAGAQVADTTPVLQTDLTLLLGTDPSTAPAAEPEAAAAPPSARFALLGVVAPRSPRGQARSTGEGVALIAIDDRGPRAYRVGARIEGDTVLQAVSASGAELGPRGGPVEVALQLPPMAAAATGTLPALETEAATPPPPAATPKRPGAGRTPQTLPDGLTRRSPQADQAQVPSLAIDGSPPDGKAPPRKRGSPTL
jgi:general secretion pathway protein C